MRLRAIAAFTAAFMAGTCLAAQATTITIATVNNSQMVVMQKLSSVWEKKTGNHINWVVLEENVLRQRVTTDIATHGGQFDIVTLGSYETPIWAKQGWLDPVGDISGYDYNDIFKSVRQALSQGGKLYALPFYAESSFTYYRKDLFQQAGLTMPDHPTWTQIDQYAAKLTDKSKQQYGICLRGKPGWGENMAFFDTLLNTYGGEWFNMKWEAQLDTKPWHDALTFYVHLLKDYGPPGASSNGFNENQALFSTGHCAMWIDATSGAGLIYDKNSSQVYDKTAFTAAPVDVTPNGSHWFWAWALAIPSTSKNVATAKDFMAWATSKDYINLVGEQNGWTTLPPGTRLSTYDNPNYLKAAPFADAVKTAILTADLDHPTKDPVPYTGIQYVSIPEFQSIGTTVGQLVAAALTGQQTVDGALKQAQASVSSTMEQAGYTQ
ncbi:MAG TPA: sugar ABC transporter substrate-binding protein [Acidisoma sp.]|jgi:sorbitol/mannitol transport system substrate-binding protein|uniref:ABC transporter substrate-binding protein n=1 Tax=Acidisoma sp. TaxID=1872115 RepID=UPI002CD5B187|nr:sugar ABC transporter substrate-binding protein [Acidisoma sp.]HTI01942.1 sugar ABC transporter substrate-binding protein [Acidisoma sp.]